MSTIYVFRRFYRYVCLSFCMPALLFISKIAEYLLLLGGPFLLNVTLTWKAKDRPHPSFSHLRNIENWNENNWSAFHNIMKTNLKLFLNRLTCIRYTMYIWQKNLVFDPRIYLCFLEYLSERCQKQTVTTRLALEINFRETRNKDYTVIFLA